MSPSLRAVTFWGLVLSTVATGCVADPIDNGRSAWWVSRGRGDRGLFGMQRSQKPSRKLALAYARYAADAGNVEEARQSYEMLLKDDPRSIDATIGLARIDQLAGRTEHAERGFQKALALRPGDPAALDALGQFYASQKRWPEALQHLNAAVLGAPDDKTYRHHFAVALASAGDVNRALQQFARTVGEAEAHYNVGHILYEQGDVAGAERQFLAAALKKPGLEVAQSMLDEIRGSQAQEKILHASAATPPQRERRVELTTRSAPPPVSTAFHELPQSSWEAPPTVSPQPKREPAPQSSSPFEPPAQAGAQDPEPWTGGSPAARSARPRPKAEPPAWPGSSTGGWDDIPSGRDLMAPPPRRSEPPAYRP